MPSKEFLMEMASHEKESGSERASARPEPALLTGTVGHTRVRTCGPGGWRLSVAGCQGRATPASTREMGMGVMSGGAAKEQLKEHVAKGCHGQRVRRVRGTSVAHRGPGHRERLSFPGAVRC